MKNIKIPQNSVIRLILMILVFLGYLQFSSYRSETSDLYTNVKTITTSETIDTKKIEKYSNPDAFITPHQIISLKENNKDIVIIGALNPLKSHKTIKDSFTLWRDDYSSHNHSFPYDGMRNTDKEMASILSDFGVNKNTLIVIYSADRHHDSGRLYWQIKLLGHENVKILDGGLNAWLAAGLPTGKANPIVKKTNYIMNKVDHDHLADFEMVKSAIDNDEWVILDVRTPEEDQGLETKSGAFGSGRIPNSILIPWDYAVNQDTTFKTIEELEEIYGDLKDKKIIVYCQSGVRSSFTTLVLTEILGFNNVYNYDGSWIEWSYEHYQKGTVNIEGGAE